MKSYFLVAGLACAVGFSTIFCTAARGEQILKPGDRVAVIGDSITEQKQYSVFIEDYLLTNRPTSPLTVAQFGWGGETAHGFANRMENDMLWFKPTVVTTCFGMNDGGYSPMNDEKADRYRKAQTEIVKKCKAAGVRVIVVGSPGCVDSKTFHRNEPGVATMYNETLAKERDIAREVAQAEGVLFADVYSAMYDAMVKGKEKFGDDYHVGGGDGVHPDVNGQLCMAFAFLKALGCGGEVAKIEVNLADNKVQASQGQKIISSSNGVIELESSRYPFCFFGDDRSPNSTRSILGCVPFNAELNRFMLVATGGSGRYKVTWGNASHEFSAEQLAAGINLAAEFLDNPFNQPFADIDHKVRDQQNLETPLVKTYIHSQSELKHMVPEEEPLVDKLIEAMKVRDQKLADQAAAAFVPVKSTIKIEKL